MLNTLDKQTKARQWSSGSQILSSHAGIDSLNWRLGLINSLENQAFTEAVLKLSEESSHSNPFFEAAFLKASTKNLGDNGVQYLYLSQQTGNQETLKFFMPVKTSKIGIFRHPVISNWTTDYSPLGEPLVVDNSNHDTLNALIECLHDADYNGTKAIVFEHVSKQNTFINALYESKQLSTKLLMSCRRKRAGLNPVSNLDYIKTHFSGKRKQRLRKARSDLDKLGLVSFENIADPAAIQLACEDFLDLEKGSWKGAQNTALMSAQNTHTFGKEVIYNMALESKCQIHALKLDGKALASLIFFSNKGHVYPWKIAFNEAYSKYSVGNLLVAHATAEFANAYSFKSLDSLAAENNETSLRFWPNEKELFTMTIGIGNNATKTTMQLTNELNLLDYVKITLKSFVKKHGYLERLVSSLRI